MSSEHTTTETLEHDGRERTYRLHVPVDASGEPRPLVLAFHGGNGRAEQMEAISGFSDLSDEEGFVVAYPQGVEGTWNDGRELDGFPAMRDDVDDIGFVESLIDHLVDEADVDPTRVYATGISNGGHLSHRLGVDLTHRLAAIAPVAASMPALVQQRPRPTERLGVIMFFGTDDPLNWWDGGGFAGGESASVPDIMRWWARHNGCENEPSVEPLPAYGDNDTSVRCESWRGPDVEVVLYAVENGGHTWPGSNAPEPLAEIRGRSAPKLDASRVMWEHFQRHDRLT